MPDEENESQGQSNSDTGQTVKDPPAPAKAATTEKRKQPTRTPPKHLPRYKLLLHNDDKNTVDRVVKVIVNITNLPVQEAVQKMLEAHNTGISLLLVTHKERAELYQEQFTSAGLTTTIEPE